MAEVNNPISDFKRIAILLGFSAYKNANLLPELPGCKNDIQEIAAILKEAEFDDILILSDSTLATENIKSTLARWVEKYRGQVEDVFYYYTGHGYITGDQFFYTLPDFDIRRPEGTGLSDNDLDKWLRGLAAKTTIKIIDACNSGRTYVKKLSKPEIMKTVVQESSSKFKNCYFMYSSGTSQLSYQNSEMSYFTQSFVKAIQTIPSDIVLYSDIMAAIRDDFHGETEQTPHFVSQGPYTEVFFKRRNPVSDVTSKIQVSQAEEQPKRKLLQQVRQHSEVVNQQHRVLDNIDNIWLQNVEEAQPSSEDLREIFEFEVEVVRRTSDLAHSVAVGKWLFDNQGYYFAAPHFEQRNPHNFMMAFILDTQSEVVRRDGKPRQEEEIDGFDLHQSVKNVGLVITATTQYSIPKFYCCITFVMSITHIRFLFIYTQYVNFNWKTSELSRYRLRASREISIGDSKMIDTELKEIIQGFHSYIADYLESNLSESNSHDL